ncbi:MAG TPA: cupredoxin domain-containing protein [Opitutaceae bacterium]|nr:cupredoxin domain-containing protein [Opitutaceae bacterium]
MRIFTLGAAGIVGAIFALAMPQLGAAAGAAEDASHAAAPSDARLHIVKIQGMAYVPARIEISLGDSVVFENHDIVPHTVTSQKPGEFDSGSIAPGKSWRFTPSSLGAAAFRCTFHPVMEGQLTIASKRAAAAENPDGGAR